MYLVAQFFYHKWEPHQHVTASCGYLLALGRPSLGSPSPNTFLPQQLLTVLFGSCCGLLGLRLCVCLSPGMMARVPGQCFATPAPLGGTKLVGCGRLVVKGTLGVSPGGPRPGRRSPPQLA